MKGTHFAGVSVSRGDWVCCLPRAVSVGCQESLTSSRLHKGCCEAPRHPGDTSTPGGHCAQGLFSQLTKEPERLLLTGPLRSLLAALIRQNNKGKQRASEESFDRLPNVFRAGGNVLIHKNCFFFITFQQNSFA